MFSKIEEIARVAQDNLRYVSLSLRENMPFLVYNIKGKTFFHQEGQKRTLLRTITCRTHESAEWNLILYHDAKAMKPALLKDIPRRWNYNTYRQS